MLNGWFSAFIVLWSCFLVFLFAVGGYFMFQKFLKKLPKEDGKSILDQQNDYIKRTLHLWTTEYKELLEELVRPVPELFRDAARQKIASKIGEVALAEKAEKMTLDIVIRGYILATPKRDHKFLRKKLQQMDINYSRHEHLFHQEKLKKSL
ncbi:hypothetical protein BpJC7_02610 [Weizmannia acidilactici]|uniref:Uncharacterized protein n=1 Tax=Weizmannia acidilactici TaxID=2607726 RepID=A0A5J4JF50_9BACI|nr:DUF2621 family protein [Weizmannia acidilactici]GER67721.1 hypothetical protein BpJC4_21920 [Weizmannia acidilactici]GER68958.1 hypothetical protein BpJC7_02610 [Weizmannia acidilactici]GER73861.1 hypothetical protein BpPP18_19280 [Weizmannia acidilactici]